MLEAPNVALSCYSQAEIRSELHMSGKLSSKSTSPELSHFKTCSQNQVTSLNIYHTAPSGDTKGFIQPRVQKSWYTG